MKQEHCAFDENNQPDQQYVLQLMPLTGQYESPTLWSARAYLDNDLAQPCGKSTAQWRQLYQQHQPIAAPFELWVLAQSAQNGDTFADKMQHESSKLAHVLVATTKLAAWSGKEPPTTQTQLKNLSKVSPRARHKAELAAVALHRLAPQYWFVPPFDTPPTDLADAINSLEWVGGPSEVLMQQRRYLTEAFGLETALQVYRAAKEKGALQAAQMYMERKQE